MKKYRSREQVETAQARAVRFASNFLKDDDLADELESLSPEEYATRRGLVITNPVERRYNMANGETKQDLQDAIDEATQILEDAYHPESTRETLASAVGDALAALQGDTGEDEVDDEEQEEDDGQE